MFSVDTQRSGMQLNTWNNEQPKPLIPGIDSDHLPGLNHTSCAGSEGTAHMLHDLENTNISQSNKHVPAVPAVGIGRTTSFCGSQMTAGWNCTLWKSDCLKYLGFVCSKCLLAKKNYHIFWYSLFHYSQENEIKLQRHKTEGWFDKYWTQTNHQFHWVPLWLRVFLWGVCMFFQQHRKFRMI